MKGPMVKARWILENHEPDPLPQEVLDQVRAIVQQAEDEAEQG